ncbi:MAG TPA: hypothetical protein VHV50_03295, partial [Actinomycetota bacterium]|nr:hypothetical protein [Actinomycetota bacterium]
MTTASVADAVSKAISEVGQESSVELAIFTTDEPPAVAEVVEDFARRHLRSPVEECLFYVSHQGAVVGLQLQDGRRVVLKAHQPVRSAAFLAVVHEVQRHLRLQGYPCPAPILGPEPLG